MLNFSFTQLQYILAVDKLKNFGKAAKACNVSQPSLSAQIQKIEQELEVIIFDRSKNPIVTTDIGKKIIKQAQIILKERERLVEVITNDNNKYHGSLNIAIIPTIATYLIPQFLNYFEQTFPEIKLILSELTTDQIISALERDEIDGGVLATPLYNDNIIERHLYYEEFYLYINPNHPLAKQKQIKEQDLINYTPWLLTEGHCFRNQALNLCNFKQITNNIHFESGAIETLIRLVDKQTSYTIIPHMALNYLTEQQQKNVHSFQRPTPSREISLVHARIFLKEKLLNCLEQSIIHTLPQDINTNKKDDLIVIDI